MRIALPGAALPRPSVLLLLGAAIASVSQAQDDIEQVIVSASRAEESGFSLPVSWSRIDREELQLTAAVHINQLMQRTPGAWISRGNGQESLPALRSPVFTGAGGCGAIFMGWDGIALRAPGFCNLNQLFDVNSEQAGRVEVLRGPGTIVYGANALHGVINVLTPDLADAERSRVALEFGSNDYYRLRLAGSQRNGAHQFGAFLNAADDGGWKDDSGFDQQKLTLKHQYAASDWQVTSALEMSNLNQETAGFIRGFESYRDSDLRRSNPNPEAYRDSFSLRGYSRWTRESGGRQLSITPYVRHTDMEFLQHFLPWQPVEKNGQTGAGLQVALSESGERLDWRAGLDMDLTRGWLEEDQERPFSPNQPQGIHYDYEVDALSAALYGQLTYRATDRLSLISGVRLEYNGYDYDNLTGDGSACAPEASACRFFRPADRDDQFTNGSVNLAASYALRENQQLYLRAARGFRPPQAAELYRLQAGQAVADLDSESILSVDLGYRGRSASLRYDVSLFAMRKDDVIFQNANRQNVSGAETEHHGLEFGINWSGDDGWYAGVDGTIAVHRYASSANLLGSSLDLDGRDIDTSPRHYGSARFGRHFEAGALPPISAELEWVHLSEYYVDPNNAHEYDGHDLLNLRLLLQSRQGLGAALRVTNLMDEDYAERADFGFGQYRYFVGEARGVFLELSWRRP